MYLSVLKHETWSVNKHACQHEDIVPVWMKIVTCKYWYFHIPVYDIPWYNKNDDSIKYSIAKVP